MKKRFSKRYYRVHLTIVFPLLITFLVSGYGIILLYNLPYTIVSLQQISRLKQYFLLGILFSFLIGLALSYAILLPIRKVVLLIKNLDEREGSLSELPNFEFEEEFSQFFSYFKNLKISLQEQNKKEIFRRLAGLGLLATGIAHEIRNPLGSIKGLTNLIDEELPEGDNKKRYTRIILKEIDRLADVINKFLNLSILQHRSFKEEEIDLNLLLDELVSLASFNPYSKNIQIIKEALKEVKIFGDREKLKQAFFNIILNAFLAMPEGGQLKISISRLPNDSVRIAFQDTGIGIPKEDMERIFEPFFTTRQGSAGLGLAITYQIISIHRGEVEVESRVGKGSSFIITLPKAKYAKTSLYSYR